MGIVNVTPDSFSDGGRYFDPQAAIAHGRKLLAEGADLLDIGGESTRPGASPPDPEEEIKRVEPVIAALSGEAVISVDTRREQVARAALEAGAHILNDISANPALMDLAASYRAGLVVMHMQGEPATMQDAPCYSNVVEEVRDFLLRKAGAAIKRGVSLKSLILDPGIGFGKNLSHNLSLLKALGRLTSDFPLLLGLSRKRFLRALSGENFGGPAANVAASLWGVSQGAKILRTHEIAPLRQALKVWEAIKEH
jgi:dihydropteroate synthase